jgi:hypothetical protein
MTVANNAGSANWILLIFNLPAKQASQRVEIWRKLKRYGAFPLQSGGHLLPNTPVALEHFEWLATMIRKFRGQASVIQIHSVDDHPDNVLRQLFIDARSRDYEELLAELKKISRLRNRPAAKMARVRRRLQEVSTIDFFNSPLRSRVEAALARTDNPESSVGGKALVKKDYLNRTWITRPRPGIDRVSSAWLISRFIDRNAKFVFDANPGRYPKAVPFDMFQGGGFGHRGEDCTFETLCKEFGIRDGKVLTIAQMIHDADLDDEKFGRGEAIGLDRVLIGWAQEDIGDDELLHRGMQLIEGLYRGQQ